ncbi:hypothetical protein [Bacteroides caecigallinarum]|nr:hypothetical protein [Bacteroides caecigallinarum]
MKIWTIGTMEGDCVMLMLCLGIACSHVHSVEAVQSRHQKVV